MPEAAVARRDAAEAPYQKSGPTLLAEQPASIPARKLWDDPDWPAERQQLEQQLTSLRTWRNSWWMQNWSDIALFLIPRRSIWLTQTTGGWPAPNSMTRGRPINTAIINPTGTYALRVCAAGLMSGLASPSRPWFKVIPGIKRFVIDASARMWLDDLQDRMYTVLAGSNFYNSFAQECEDVCGFGTGPSLMYEDERDLIRLYNPAVGEYYLANGGTMRVDTFYRLFLMTVQQMVDFFKLENVSQEVASLWQQKGAQLQTERLIAHAITPNYGVGAENIGRLPGPYAYKEYYWIFGTEQKPGHPLSKAGFFDSPFTAARWTVQSNDAYGRSVGMDVLPDIMQLQMMERRKAEGIEKHVRPPLVADMSLKHQPSSTLPGQVTYVQSLGPQTGMRPIYEVQPDLQYMIENIKEIEQRIGKGFFNDLFLMLEQITGQKMTAYEVAQKMQEKLQVLGPVIEGLLAESLKPKLKRLFAIMKRKGLIDPPPDSLRGIPLDVEFVSILALAQKAAATGGIERLAAFLGNLVGIFPEAKDILNIDNTMREFNDLLGNPEKILNGPEEVENLRAQRAQQMEKQQKMAAAAATAKTTKDSAQAAQVLSQTKIGAGQDVLSTLLGAGGGGGSPAAGGGP